MAIVRKVCCRCKAEKPIGEFPKWKHSADGYNPSCAVCRKAYQQEYYRKNKKKLNENQAKYYQANREKTLAYQKEWQSRPENKERYRDLSYQRRFGITIEDYDRMYAEQDGVCKICGREETNERYYQRLSVDHCHNTGAVRGLLCNNCNRALGLLNDDPTILHRAIEYLESFTAHSKE